MRTTIDLPDALFRKTKATAALRGVSLKQLIIVALEREFQAPPEKPRKRLRLPLVSLGNRKQLNLKGVDFDDLLA